MDDIDKVIESLSEPSSPQPNQYTRLKFHGKGSTYFGIVALNVVLTVVTVGLYYPWAKAAYRKYVWNETEFKDSRFIFNGTGKEMFKGFLIAYAILLGFYGSIALTSFYTYGWMFILLFYVLLLFLIPFAIYGAWKYRVSRTSWRGIFFQFDGRQSEFLKLFVVQIFLVIITIGIYGPWFRVKLQKYLLSHTRIGNLRLGFRGEGVDLFVINLVGIFLTVFTLYLYLPIFIKSRFEFTVNHTSISDGTTTKLFRSELSNGTAWKVLMSNFLMLIFTLGLAFPWVFVRSMRMFSEHALIPDEFNYDALAQSDTSYKDATGDELSDILDMDFDF